MISVGSRDARKELGFGSGRVMEETELEEGEACYYQDDDDNIDPDVALSYLDEKVQVVLGHFQKDFEGGVSAENLGSKFGGYGSFLPTHQRSPSVWSHPRTPQKVQSQGTPASPNNFAVEDIPQNSTVPSNAAVSSRLGSASINAVPALIPRAPSSDSSSKRDVCLSSTGIGKLTPQNDAVNRSVNSNEPKSLKVLIKVGPGNMAQKNAAIYSGLGLDISPSSSLEDSPIEIGGMSPDSQNTPEKSPTSILQIMTSFPLSGSFLLSPLPDNLLHLMEKGAHIKDATEKNLAYYVDEPHVAKGEERVITENKIKSIEKNGHKIEVKSRSGKDAGYEMSSLLRKEIDIETQAGLELVSNALNLPILSDSKLNTSETAKSTGRISDIPREANKGGTKQRLNSSYFAKEEELDLMGRQDMGRVEKRSSNDCLLDKVWEDRKSSHLKDVQVAPKKDGRKKADKICDPLKAEFDGSKGRNDNHGRPVGHPKDKVSRKATSHEQDGIKHSQAKEQLSSRGKKKLKGTQSNGNPAIDFQIENLRAGSSATSKNKNKIDDDYLPESKLDDSKFRKESGKARENHRDSFADGKVEALEDLLLPPFRDRVKETKFGVAEKENLSFVDKSKEKPIGRKADNLMALDPNPASNVASHSTGNLPGSVPLLAAPLVIEENWVCCDKCQKWRLLPFGTNPDHLPKKWLCSMLNWLRPGMNRCNISEEETTKALNALYQVPVQEGQGNLLTQPIVAASGVPFSEGQNLHQMHQVHSLQPIPSGGKKKNGLREIVNTASYTAPLHFSDSTMKDQQASVKSKHLNDANQCPLESNQDIVAGFQQSSKSSDSSVEKKRQRQKEKHKLAQDGGEPKRSKTKSRSEVDQDEIHAFKRNKTEASMHEDWNSDRGVITGKIGPSTISSLSAKVTGQNVEKYDEYSFSKDSTCDPKDSLPAPSVRKVKDQVPVSSDGGDLDMVKSDQMDISLKKRKVKDSQESDIYPTESLPYTNRNFEDNKALGKEMTSESELRKEKKAKGYKSERKDLSTYKEDRTDKKGRVTRIVLSGRDPVGDGMEEDGKDCIREQQLGQYRGGNAVSQQTLDGIDALKRDLGYGQPSLATTSSSSKVSGSNKSKANFPEVKGSPVESVSSSPLRISNPDKVTSTKREMGKDDATNVGYTIMDSPRKCSDGEGDIGINRPGTIRKEKTSSLIPHESMESTFNCYQDREAMHVAGGKAKGNAESSPFELVNPMNGGFDAVDQHNLHPGEHRGKDHSRDDRRVNSNHHRSNGSHSKKSGKGSSSRSKDKQKGSKSDFGKSKNKVSKLSSDKESYPTKSSRNEPAIESQDRTPFHEDTKDEKYKVLEKCNVKSGKDVNPSDVKSIGKWTSEGRKENQTKFGGHDSSDVKPGATAVKDGNANPQQKLMQVHGGEKSSKRVPTDRIDQDTASGRGKSHAFPHSGDKQEIQTRCPRPTPGTSGGGGDALRLPKQLRRPDYQNGAHSSSMHSTTNGHVGDREAPSPLRKDSFTQTAANALKEAKDLKHSADRLKNLGSALETTGLYFQAALKFLHGASLLEHCNNESAKHGEMTQSMGIYSSTAKLCAFVAHEYERCKEMAAAALAYKCMEVAYMRVIYFKHSIASKDRHELQTALQMVPPGESPSSSASDIDNLNQGTLDKLALTKGVHSPHVAGNHVIVAKNRPNFVRLLNFAEDVNFAMEASRKSQNAFAAANVSLEEARFKDGISSIKRALDFNFHDVQGLLRLVRLAMEVISR